MMTVTDVIIWPGDLLIVLVPYATMLPYVGITRIIAPTTLLVFVLLLSLFLSKELGPLFSLRGISIF